KETRVAAKGPVVRVSIGYAYLNSEIPSVGRISENGVATGIAVDFTDRFGIKVESSYTRTYGAFGLPHHSDVLALMAGPVIYPVRRPRFAMYAEGLVGGTRIVGVVPEKQRFLPTRRSKEFRLGSRCRSRNSAHKIDRF